MDADRKHLNVKVPPCEAPHPRFVFKGYEFSNDKKRVYALFANPDAAKVTGTRRSRRGGGVNQSYHCGLAKVQRLHPNNRAATLQYMQETTYIVRGQRFGPHDPQI